MKKVKSKMIFKWFLGEKSSQSLLVKKTKSLKRRKKKSQSEQQPIDKTSMGNRDHKIKRDQESKTLYKLPEMQTIEDCESKV